KKVSKVRVVKFPLDTGEIETIATNIFSTDFTEEDFKELYFLRWGIETKYKEIKSTLKIENFTGDKPVCVEQDFYANMLISNICSVIKSETDEIIKEDLVEKNSKANYQTNRRLLIYRVVRKIITLIE
ncbi:transposase, partial [Anaerocolumna aminovalerica]|uniref:transposase n=1 Tax=Anaerocolumna aminovalerica TaxID=1527 RepID=UPI0031ED4F4A